MKRKVFIFVFIFIFTITTIMPYAYCSNVNSQNRITILCYHSVNPNSYNDAIITPDVLKTHLLFIKNHHYNTLSINDVYEYLTNNTPIPPKSILITFDDGYMDNYYYAFPLLKELHMKATIFCITNSLNGKYYLSEDAMKTMSDNNIDIESHTYNHKKLSSLPYKEQVNEMLKSKETLEKIINKNINAIAYPYGAYNDTTLKAAYDAGYTLGFTTEYGYVSSNTNRLKLNRIYIGPNYTASNLENILIKNDAD